MITSRLMLSTLLLGSLALPAQAHAVAPRLNGPCHHQVRPVYRVAATTDAVPDVRAPVVAATLPAPMIGPAASSAAAAPSTMPHTASSTAPTPHISATAPATPGVKAN